MVLGVQLGDIGPKIGASSIGNGYAMFNHVRIPRENMLMRYTKVCTVKCRKNTCTQLKGTYICICLQCFV